MNRTIFYFAKRVFFAVLEGVTSKTFSGGNAADPHVSTACLFWQMLFHQLNIELGKLECVLDPFVLAFSVETMRFHNGGYRVAKRDLDIF